MSVNQLSPYRFIHLTNDHTFDNFSVEINAGLSATEKYIDNKYMYDTDGSQLFEKILQDPNYYQAYAETEILNRYAVEMISHLPENSALIELGSGSATKTRYLLEALLHKQGTALFCPIDISGDFLQNTVKRLSSEYVNLQILGVIADYYSGLTALTEQIQQPKLLVWLGSDLGHVNRSAAAALLREKILPALQIGDKLLLGIDLKKDTDLLQRAYGCHENGNSIRYRFNCNALHRINQKLGGNFVPENFQRLCFYNADAGRIEVYLKSICEQQVRIDSLGKTFYFKTGELLRFHYAYKYDQDDILYLGNAAGVRIEQQWFDSKHFFSLNLFSVERH